MDPSRGIRAGSARPGPEVGGACFSLPANRRKRKEERRAFGGLSCFRAMAEHRRRLPHLQPDGEYLFVTWRLHGSLPAMPPDVIYAPPGHAFAAQDRALARNRGHLWLRDPRVARLVMDAVRSGEHQRRFYESQAWVVMPNHVHLLILPNVPLPEITHWIKGKTAREAQLLLGRRGGPFCQHESYDHRVRTSKERQRIAEYIEDNPVLAGLVAHPEDWPWSIAARAS